MDSTVLYEPVFSGSAHRLCPFFMMANDASLERKLTFLPRDASAERGDEIACRLSVCPPVCLSVTFRYRVQIRWNSSKIISQPNSFPCAG